jgi:NAD+ synthase
MHIRAKDIAAWLRSRVTATGADGLVVAFDGSVAAGVVARLCQLAVADRVLAAVGPNDAGDKAAVLALADVLQLPVVDVAARCASGVADELEPALGRWRRRSEPSPDAVAARGVMTIRMRMAAIRFVAESLNHLVVGTLDRTDLTVGAFARDGECAVDLMPLGNAMKGEVLALAHDLDLPAVFLEQAQDRGRASRDEVGLTHQHLERYLADGPDAVAPAVALKIERLMRESERKRAPAEIPGPDAGLTPL